MKLLQIEGARAPVPHSWRRYYHHCWWNIHYYEGFRFITALHEMQTRSSDENSVCLSVRPSVRPSVRLSVTRVIPDKMEESWVQIFIPYERTFSLVFW